MTAPALNIASIAPTAQPGGAATAGKAGVGAGALAGFEAMLGALFPQADPTAVATKGAATTVAAGTVATDPAGPGVPKAATDPDAIVDATDPTAQAPAIGDAATALAASLMATQTAAVETQITTAKDPNATQAVSPGAAKALPLPPGFVLGGAKGQLNGKDEEPAGIASPGVATADLAQATDPAQAAAAAPQAHNPAAQASAPQAPTPQANATPPAAPMARPEIVAAAVVADTPADAPPVDAGATASDAVALTEAAPVAAPPLRATRTERAKAPANAATDNAEDLKPLEAADKPAIATAVQGAAKPASAKAEGPESADAQAQDTKVETDTETPDFVLPAETRAASQAATTATHTATGARGGPETVANLAAQIAKNVDGKTTRFDVELNPHGLGKVDVRIEIGAQGRITAGMTFDNPQAAADVKARAAELQQALEQAGFDLSGGLSFDVAQDRGQQQQQNQAWQDQGDTGRAFQGRAFRAALDTAGDAAEAANQGALRLRRGANSGLDLRI